MIQASLHAALGSFKSTILATKDAKEALEALQVWRFFSPHTPVFVLPELRAHYLDDMRAFSAELKELLSTLGYFYTSLKNDPNTKLLAPLSALLNPLPCPKLLQSFAITCLESYDLQDLQERLRLFGYDFVDLIELPGEASFRGDIVDIFIPGQAKPHRLSFLGQDCEDIRTFDPRTQLSDPSVIEQIDITPALFSLDAPTHALLQQRLDKLNAPVLLPDLASLGFWVLEDLGRDFLTHYSVILSAGAKEQAKEWHNLESSPALERALSLPLLPTPPHCQDIQKPANWQDFLELNAAKKITLIAKNADFLPITNTPFESAISTCVLHFSTPTQLFLSTHGYEPPKGASRSKLMLNELVPGDFVVHENYGIGLFKGLVQQSVLGSVRDFIALEYQNADRLLLPVENLHLIERYIANQDMPLLDKLGKGNFAKVKDKVRAKILDMSAQIIALAAKRNLLKNDLAQIDTHQMQVFKKACGFALTVDQEQSIAAILQDFASGQVMDRLLNGDVGFGKTEVAMHAIYAIFLSGKQSALFVPTTLLCAQHFATLKARLEPFGLKVAKLDRFSRDKKAVLEGLKKGLVDVVVGTHALLDAKFKELGLVVVDEEHKFGVKQKEAIKALSESVHCLSMSATPIPRTLSMALSKLKGVSTLNTPPSIRQPSRTFVKEKTDALLKEAILRELRRKGQVFYIHNHIESMPKVQAALLKLLPHLRVQILHSKVPALQAEQALLDFAKGDYEVLLCTSIVESGIHLPNANTIIIDNADNFGLADLHQLRGRVGRGHLEGFCYFLVQDTESLSNEAKKRLLALEKNSYLGSGASIAMHDLQIRGGGNFLGAHQSGHIKSIGYGLYTKMLEEAICGRTQDVGVDLSLSVSGFLSPKLIASDSLRLELYRRLGFCKDLASVQEIQAEMRDRFGVLDTMSTQFLQIIRIKILANRLKISKISQYGQNVTLFMGGDQNVLLKAPSKDDGDILHALLSHLQACARTELHPQP
ncbi:Transcription-repair coupling factor [Helicobacter sp. NHP21005]|uniref:transcription-repair coupling factor n=1 Tax=Helicobacter felistomachi TaxID=3040201 RepID=UPI0025739D7A|nr:transcription-repair coupling factor [Helicobacter sp. NHP21005]BEG56345.1 Transcription-repair coupling factor [Helicobacter sp. NHP21005]